MSEQVEYRYEGCHPTEPGWYWAQAKMEGVPNMPIEPFEIFETHRKGHAPYLSDSYGQPMAFEEYRWFGPITMVKENL